MTTPDRTVHVARDRLPALGEVEVAATSQGICAIALPQWNDHDLRLTAWVAAGWQARRDGHELCRQALEELRAFATGKSREFTVPLDLGLLPPFPVRVLRSLLRVPAGRLITYGRLAAWAGSPQAARAVGGAVGRNPIPVIIPCHRVVAGNGIGGFGLGLDCKRALLGLEGVTADAAGQGGKLLVR